MTEFFNSFEWGAYKVAVHARTDVGKVRTVNEDDFCISDRIWAVSDGMGGHQAGDVASSIAVAVCHEVGERTPLTVADTGQMIVDANDAVRLHAVEHDTVGMGATLVGVALADNGGEDSLVVFNVGDSRCYEVVGESELRQITVDHSLVQEMVDAGSISAEEADSHPRRNVITRGVGIEPHVQPDLVILNHVPHRRIVLCSDGVSGEIDRGRMESIIRAGSDPAAVADGLLAAALEGPARDNATVLVADFEWAPTTDDLEESTCPRPGVDVDESTAPRQSAPSTAESASPDRDNELSDEPVPSGGLDSAAELISDVPESAESSPAPSQKSEEEGSLIDEVPM